jgi:hypothetical protein
MMVRGYQIRWPLLISSDHFIFDMGLTVPHSASSAFAVNCPRGGWTHGVCAGIARYCEYGANVRLPATTSASTSRCHAAWLSLLCAVARSSLSHSARK